MTPIARTRVKICGITRPEDGMTATALGADAIGLVFHPLSPRYVNIDTARHIIALLPPFVTPVGLFRNEEPTAVQAVLAAVPIAMLQFHGEEDPDYCAVFGLPYIKAVPMGAGADVADYEQRFATAAGLLLDSHGGNTMGGSGHGFDWSNIPRERRKPLILAGGLNPDNIADAIRQVHPYAVDVSSGVERAKGIKDVERMRAFLQGVYNDESHA
jgi:phosphoribosylanthranilate isomerase